MNGLAATGRLAVVLVAVAALLTASGARHLAEARRVAMSPYTSDDGQIGQLNSYALALVLGGLRGPLVMALWTTSEGRRTGRELQDLQTQIELIRLLQPQFNSVHLYQIWNKAYNLSRELADPASRYAAILDAVDYARRVLRERPDNVDLETQISEVFSNRLGNDVDGAKIYFTLRVYDETRHPEPLVVVTFPQTREDAFRNAARRAGVSPRELTIRHTDDPTRRAAAVRESRADLVREILGDDPFEYRVVPPRLTRGPGTLQRLDPLLDADGRVLPELTSPTRRRADATGLDGSRIQFLAAHEPFPEGVSPFALAYEHARRAVALQRHGGQQPTQRSAANVEANPARAMRSWSIEAYESGRQLEIEAFDLVPPPIYNAPESQRPLELLTGDAPPDARPDFPLLLERAVGFYDRSVEVGALALEALQEHVRQNPQAAATFNTSLGRLRDLQNLLAADAIYARLQLDEYATDARASAAAEAAGLYRAAEDGMLEFLARYHVAPETLPPGFAKADLPDAPLEVRRQHFANMLTVLARPQFYEYEAPALEFDAYFSRINDRVRMLDELAGSR